MMLSLTLFFGIVSLLLCGTDSQSTDYEDVLQEVLSKVNDVILNVAPQTKDQTQGVLFRMLDARQILLQKEKEILQELTDDQMRKNQIRGELAGLRRIRDQVGAVLDKVSDKMTENLKADMLRLKLNIENEMLKMKTKQSAEDDSDQCDNCQWLVFVLAQLKAVLLCEAPSPLTDIDIPEVGSPLIGRPRLGDCQSHFLEIIEMIDNLITSAYLQTFLNQNEGSSSLELYREVKADVENVFTNTMLKRSDEDLQNIITKIENLLFKCREACQPIPKCNHCVEDLLLNFIKHFKTFTSQLENTNEEDEDQIKTNIRRNLIEIIDENNKIERDIIVWTATTETTDDCDEVKIETLGMLKDPFWMLVNISVQFPGTDQLKASLVTMSELLEEKHHLYCEKYRSCGSQERNNIQQVLKKLDDLILNAFFKSKTGQNMERDLTVGLIDILSIMESRVKTIFEENNRCQDEVEIIKKQYLPQLNDCIKMLLKKDEPITDIDLPLAGSPILIRPRQLVEIENIIQCPKELKALLDERNDQIIETELEKTFGEF